MASAEQPPDVPDKFTCPRRREPSSIMSFEQEQDYWEDDGTCSFCGSWRPDLFMDGIENKALVVVPTDKNYKAYVVIGGVESKDPATKGVIVGGDHKKFYYVHLSTDQMQRFVKLYNDGTMKLDYPGHLYVPPFFMHMVPK